MALEKYFMDRVEKRIYIEKTFQGTQEEYLKKLEESATLYITNIPFYLKEERLWHLFKLCGEVRRVIMGINKNKKTPAEFAFVEYYKHDDANNAIDLLRGYPLDGRPMAIDKDIGFSNGRELGRGVFGGKMKNDNYKKRRGAFDEY